MNFITNFVKERGVSQIIFKYMKNENHEKILNELKEVQRNRKEYFIHNDFCRKDNFTTQYYSEHTWIQNSNKLYTHMIVKETEETEDGELYFKYVTKGFSW